MQKVVPQDGLRRLISTVMTEYHLHMSMYTQQDLKAKIVAIDAKIESGVTSTSVDGTTVAISIAELRQERDRLNTMLDQYRKRRPTTATIYLA